MTTLDPRCPSSARARSRRGSVGQWLVLGLPMLLGIAGLAIDLGYARVQHAGLQTALDSAALAAVGHLDRSQRGLDHGMAAAIDLAASNYVDGAPVTLTEEDITFGNWDADAQVFTETEYLDQTNAVRILGGASTALPTGFAGIALNGSWSDLPLSGQATAWAQAGEWGDGDTGPGIDGGHFDLDTSSYWAGPGCSATGGGKCTDAHIHQYDDAYDTTVADAFNLRGSLHSIDDDIDPDQAFKILLLNADRSTNAQLTINGTYWFGQDYDDIASNDLPTYSLGGAAGTTQLTDLTFGFDRFGIRFGGLQPTLTSCVRANNLGEAGEWRNGALTLQAVPVNPDGTDGFTTELSYSDGGVVGGSNDFVLWELTVFWHWKSVCYGVDGYDWEPGRNYHKVTPRLVEAASPAEE